MLPKLASTHVVENNLELVILLSLASESSPACPIFFDMGIQGLVHSKQALGQLGCIIDPGLAV